MRPVGGFRRTSVIGFLLLLMEAETVAPPMPTDRPAVCKEFGGTATPGFGETKSGLETAFRSVVVSPMRFACHLLHAQASAARCYEFRGGDTIMVWPDFLIQPRRSSPS
jgi:hypothetical protein